MTATAVDERSQFPGPTRPPSAPPPSFPLPERRRVVFADDPCEAGFSRAGPEYAGMYLHARYFDPKLGTFLSPDPIGVDGGLNQYGYGFGNPVRWMDRSGLAAGVTITCIGPPQGGIYYGTGGRGTAPTGSDPNVISLPSNCYVGSPAVTDSVDVVGYVPRSDDPTPPAPGEGSGRQGQEGYGQEGQGQGGGQNRGGGNNGAQDGGDAGSAGAAAAGLDAARGLTKAALDRSTDALKDVFMPVPCYSDGYFDMDFSAGAGIGITFGLNVVHDGVYPTLGLSFGTGVSTTFTRSYENPSPGWNAEGSIAAPAGGGGALKVGRGAFFSPQGSSWYSALGASFGTNGGGGSAYYTFGKIPGHVSGCR